MAGERFEALKNVLLKAFPTEEALRELLLYKLELNLSEITTAHSLAGMVLDVIEKLESHGRLAKLVAGACELRPHHRDLDEVVRRYWPEVPRPAAPPSEVRRPQMALTDHDWAMLLDSIDAKKCTPVIGPGACQGVVPDSGELAAECADRWGYPFDDRTDLTRVSQFLALTDFPLLPHEHLHRRYAALPAPDFESPEEPHALLAELDLPLYITTNWDPFMAQALERRRIKAVRAFPRWNESLEDPAAPGAIPADWSGGALVYHLFGQHEVPESMVVTEDDCFKFFSSVVANKNMFPPIVLRALGGTSLLFIGYGVFDWGFRVLVRALLQSLTVKNRRLGMAVQLPPEALSEAQRAQIERYLERFLNEIGQIQFRVFWGNTREFIRELRTRWEEHRRHAIAG